MKHIPKPTIIYCLKNPIDRNRVFYVGRTTQKLSVRLLGHIHGSANPKVKIIIKFILLAGKRPIIQQLEMCEWYHKPYC